jgi:tetratricopeptide (TPR) repeat protein
MRHALECTLNSQYENAIRAFEKIIGDCPDFEIAYLHLSNAYDELGDVEQAIALLNKVLTIKPTYSNAVYNLSKAYRDIGDLRSAKDHVKRFIELAPNDADGYFLAASICDRLDDHKQEIVYYRAGLKRNPDSVRSWLNLGITLNQAGDFTGSVEALQEAYRLDPTSEQLGHELAAVFEQHDAHEDLTVLYEQMLLRHPNSPHTLQTRFLLGVAYHRSRRNDEAVRILEGLIRLSPHHGGAMLLLAVCYMNCRKVVAARKCYERALELDPQNASKVAHIFS